jgi:hypothetical protein
MSIPETDFVFALTHETESGCGGLASETAAKIRKGIATDPAKTARALTTVLIDIQSLIAEAIIAALPAAQKQDVEARLADAMRRQAEHFNKVLPTS